MSEKNNPYPETITDESSGVRVASIAHRIWLEGYQAGRQEAAGEKTPEANG